VHSLVLSLGLLAAGSTHHAHIVRPGRASREDIAAYHDTEYVDFVLNPRNSVAGVVTDEHIRFGLEDVCLHVLLAFT
jgi:histone deacetylase 8